jgi:hypothetical protein
MGDSLVPRDRSGVLRRAMGATNAQSRPFWAATPIADYPRQLLSTRIHFVHHCVSPPLLSAPRGNLPLLYLSPSRL